MVDSKLVKEYHVDKNGVICVVNGKVYVKEVTK